MKWLICTRVVTLFPGAGSVLVLAGWLSIAGAGQCPPAPLPAPMDDLIQNTIRFVFLEDFTEALQSARRIVKAWGDHPAGYFFCASVLDAQMAFDMSSKLEDEFYRYCNEAVDKGEQMLIGDPRNIWARFFVGGAEGLKGNYEFRYQRWITAFRYGWKGVSVLKRVQNDCAEIADVRYGIGTYRYWRSAMTDVMRWMPGVKDEKAEGIEDLVVSMHSGVYTSISSAANLLDIYDNEKRFADMLVVADSILVRFPENVFFRWNRAKALVGLGKYDEAVAILEALILRVDTGPSTRYYSILCRCTLIEAYCSLGKASAARESMSEIKKYKLVPDVQRLIQKKLSQVDQLIKSL